MTQSPQPPAGGPVVEPTALGPADVWRILKKRFWLIVACFVIFGLGGTGGVIAWYYLAPYYTAEGYVEVQPGQGQTMDLVRGFEPGIDPRILPQFIESQVLAIKNPRVLQAALDALKGKQTMYLGRTAVQDLSEDLTVTHIPNTQNILVSLTGRNAEEVKEIVREVLSQYISQLQADQQQADADRQRELRSERDDLRRQLDDLARSLARYREESSVVTANEQGSEQMARLVALVRQLTDVQAQLAEAAAAWNQFQELRKQAEETNDLSPILMAFPEIMEALRTDRTLTVLRQQVAALQQQLDGLKQRFGPEHEQVRRATMQLQAAQNDLESQRNEILNQLVQQQAAALKNRYDQARALEADLQARVGEARAAAVSIAKLSAEYRAREAQYQRLQEMLNTVETGLERMRIASALSRPNIRVVSWPQIPVEPSEPRVVLYPVAVLVFSLLVGIGLSLLIELADTRLRTPAQVARQVGVPVLATVPDLSEDDRLALGTNLATVSQTAPQSLLAEAFRQLRTSLLFASDRPVRCLLVSSPGPGDGKTTVAANLAITLARAGTRTLLVEANFRRPALARHFDLPDGVGLSNVLVGLNRPEEAIQATAIENLDVLVCGASPPSPAELLGSASMRRFLEAQVQDYDQVILDGAPMLVVADNHLMADTVDGVVLVFQADQNTRGLAQRAVRQVLSLRAHLFGAVLNRVRATKGGYFRESFEAYYDYAGGARPVAAAAMTSARPQRTPPASSPSGPEPPAGEEGSGSAPSV